MFGISGIALAIIAAAIAVPSIGWWYSGNELRVCNAEYQSFQNTTKLEGERSEHERTTKETALSHAAVNIQGELNAKQTEFNNLYTDYDRLRRANKGGSRSGKNDPLADSAERFNCPDGGTELATALERLEVGVLPILKSRDEAINRTVACKKYVEEITEVINKNESN